MRGTSQIPGKSGVKPVSTTVIQPKLMVNTPGDRYEREADAMAERVMRTPMSKGSPVGTTSMVGQSIQRKCAHCEEEARKKNASIMRKAEQPGLVVPSSQKATGIQRKCQHCEEEEKKKKDGTLMRKAETGGGFEAPSSVTSMLSKSRGSGYPLPQGTRSFMEGAFSTDFSNVRIHTDSNAVKMNEEVNAKAFTYGNDIYFNRGQYSVFSSPGKRLLAHELSHVLQQGFTPGKSIYRDEENADQSNGEDTNPQTQTAEDTTKLEDIKASGENPIAAITALLDRLDEPDETTEVEGAEMTDDEAAILDEDSLTDMAGDVVERDKYVNPELEDAKAWLGEGAEAEQKRLFVVAELQKLGDDTYLNSVIETFYVDEEHPDEMYLASLKTDIDFAVGPELTALSALSSKLSLGLTEYNFIDDFFIIFHNGANAFPELTKKILYPLIRPPEVYSRTAQAAFQNSRNTFYSRGFHVTPDMEKNGLPKSYVPSLQLKDYPYYKLVKDRKVLLPGVLPNPGWMYSNFILPEEEALHTDPIKTYASDFSYYASAAVELSIYEKWALASQINWVRFNTFAISSFRKDYPSGLHNLQEFYRFERAGALLALADLVETLLLGIRSAGTNPYSVLGNASKSGKESAQSTLDRLVSTEAANFQEHLRNANAGIASLSDSAKFGRAVKWSFTKGFAGESIMLLLENVDKILWEMAKGWAKQIGIGWVKKKAPQKLITMGLGSFVPGLNVALFIYNVWDFFDDVSEIQELYDLVTSFLAVVDEAKSSTSVIETQHAAAVLAQAYETIFQKIIEKLGSKILNKLSSYAKGKLDERSNRKQKMSEARRYDLVSDSANQPDAKKLDEPHLDAELQTAISANAVPISHPDYDVEVSVGNSHTWSRLRGTRIWCRSSPFCTLPDKDSPLFDELNKKADAVAPKSPIDTEDMGKQLTDELDLSAPSNHQRVDVSKAVADAIGGKFVSQKGVPLTVDLAIQPHNQATTVRQGIGVTGKDEQSAHTYPTAAGKQTDGYSRGQALTVLMPPDVHRAFDDYWKKKSIELRKNGETDISVDDFMSIMYDAVDQIPGMTNKAKGAIHMVMRKEVYEDLGLSQTDRIELPFKNVK